MQATLVEVLLRDLEATIGSRAFNRRVLAVQHDVIVNVNSVIDPIAASLGIGALDHQLIQHVLNDSRNRSDISVALYSAATCGTRLPATRLRSPSMLKTFPTKVVLARKLYGAIEGRVADETDEVAIGVGEVFEGLELGRDFDDAALAALG